MLTSLSYSQIYLTEEWVHTTGIPDTVDYSASKIDGSGNIYVTTNTISATEKANILTTKYNSSGVVQWEVEKDNADENDYGSAVDVDGSGNVYVAAATWVDATNKYDYLIIKYNASGAQQWTATYNGPGNFYDIPTDIFVDGSGNVYVTGASYGSGTLSDYYTIKYNASGTQQWASRYDYSADQDIAAILKESPSGRIVVVGASENAPGSYDFAMVKYNQNTGSQISSNRNSASGTGFDQVFGADVDALGNIYITGRASVLDEGYNMKTVKLDTALSVVWSRNYDFAGFDDESHGIVVDLDYNVYIAGWVTNEDGSKSIETIKYNSSGTPQWQREESSPIQLDAYGLKISYVVDGNIAVAGNIDNGASLDFLTVIYNTDGERLWLEQYDSPNKNDDKINFVKADSDGVFYVGGKSYSISTSTNRLIKYNSNSFITPPDNDMDHPSQFTFFENKGQLLDTDEELAEDLKFYTNKTAPSLYFTDVKLSYVWTRIDTTEEEDTIERIDMTFVNAKVGAEIHRATGQGGEYLNYFLPHCSDGITNVRSSDRLIVPEVYDDVDVEYYFDQNGLKYYIIIKPGWSTQADPISLLYDGAVDVNILGGGELEIVGVLGTLTQEVAETYQIDESGDLEPLAWDAEFDQLDDFEIGFVLDTYDEGLPLVIEMKLGGPAGGPDDYENIYWSTVYQFTAGEGIEDVGYDSKNNPVILANTTTLEFPTGTGLYNPGDLTGITKDIMINDFDEDRASIWAAVIGGTGPDYAEEFDVNMNTGFIYAVGTTYSTDFYSVDPGGDSYFVGTKTNVNDNEGFIFRINGAGNLVDWSSYVEGIILMNDIDFKNDYSEFSIVGNTDGDESAWPLEEVDGGFFEDGAITSAHSYVGTLNNDYELFWGTLYWGFGAQAVHYDAMGRINIGGQMFNAFYFETVDDIGDTYEVGADGIGLYFATFNSLREVYWATPYGSDGVEYLTGIATTPSDLRVVFVGNVIPDGILTDLTWPAENTIGGGSYFKSDYNDLSATSDGFMVTFDFYRDLLISTLFGGEEDDKIRDVVYANGNFWFTGQTSSDNTTFPYEEYTDYFDDQDDMNDVDGLFGSDPSNAFLSIIDPSATLIYSTYFGGTISTGARDIAYNDFIDHIITSGFANFETGEDAGFVPLEPFLPDGYFQPTNPEYPSFSGVNFITEWGVFPVIVSITEPENANSPSIYPNPTCNDIYFTLTETTEYFIYDLSGRLVALGKLNSGEISLDLSKYASGIYNMRFIGNDVNSIYKIVKL